MQTRGKITELVEKGVTIPSPGSVVISDDVDTARISGKGVVINPGCVLKGSGIFIGNNTVIGSEGPAVLENVALSGNMTFASGFARDSVFLSGVSAGANSHIREGCLLEEFSGTAHTVGLKQTILFPFVTLGSLINFCDCLMSGGTDRKNHSEVGSSYIHFNYTPNQDKATPSIMGNVPDGVMMDRPPVFLGGQGGMVGPCRIAFGTVITAGSICRKDVLHEGRMVSEVHGRSVNTPRKSGFYSQVKRTFINNIFYIANIIALSAWYRNVRCLFISDDNYPEPVHDAALKVIESALKERKKRLLEFCEKMPASMETYINHAGENASPDLLKQKKNLYSARNEIINVIDDFLKSDFKCHEMDLFMEYLIRSGHEKKSIYHESIALLPPGIKKAGSDWLWKSVRTVSCKVSEKMTGTGLEVRINGER